MIKSYTMEGVELNCPPFYSWETYITPKKKGKRIDPDLNYSYRFFTSHYYWYLTYVKATRETVFTNLQFLTSRDGDGS